jgi:hypothetical protein
MTLSSEAAIDRACLRLRLLSPQSPHHVHARRKALTTHVFVRTRRSRKLSDNRRSGEATSDAPRSPAAAVVRVAVRVVGRAWVHPLHRIDATRHVERETPRARAAAAAARAGRTAPVATTLLTDRTTFIAGTAVLTGRATGAAGARHRAGRRAAAALANLAGRAGDAAAAAVRRRRQADALAVAARLSGGAGVAAAGAVLGGAELPAGTRTAGLAGRAERVTAAAARAGAEVGADPVAAGTPRRAGVAAAAAVRRVGHQVAAGRSAPPWTR